MPGRSLTGVNSPRLPRPLECLNFLEKVYCHLSVHVFVLSTVQPQYTHFGCQLLVRV